MILQSCWSALMSIPKPKHENMMGLEQVQGFSTMLVKTAIGQFTNLHQADLQSLNASQATNGTFEQPGSFSMVEAS